MHVYVIDMWDIHGNKFYAYVEQVSYRAARREAIRRYPDAVVED
jgi:hypothetical protein